MDCLSKSIRREGILKLWVGLPVFIARGGPHSFLIILIQNKLQKHFNLWIIFFILIFYKTSLYLSFMPFFYHSFLSAHILHLYYNYSNFLSISLSIFYLYSFSLLTLYYIYITFSNTSNVTLSLIYFFIQF